MDHRTITVFNWMALILLGPLTIVLAWKMISEKLKGKKLSADLVSAALGLAFSITTFVQMNVRETGRLKWALLLLQVILLVLSFKGLPLRLKQMLLGRQLATRQRAKSAAKDSTIAIGEE